MTDAVRIAVRGGQQAVPRKDFWFGVIGVDAMILLAVLFAIFS